VAELMPQGAGMILSKILQGFNYAFDDFKKDLIR
jgi:hypothetical protein